MKSIRKLFTLALALLMILECFAGPALATTMDADAESLTVSDEAMAEAESSVPESSDEEPSEPASSEPESSVPESSVPDNTVPENSEPESSEPESSVPESSEPESSVPESSVPESSVPESSEPENTVPESSEPEPSEPENTVPESSEPESTEPEPSEPTIVDSGKCGTNVSWTLDSDGLLVISGKGDMYNYQYPIQGKMPPWPVEDIVRVRVESGVTSIGSDSFYNSGSTSQLIEVVLPDTLTKIYSGAFSGANITEITIPNSVTLIDSDAFSSCKNLTSVKLPSKLNAISSNLFAACSSLTEIKIPTSVTKIGRNAFYNCSKLTEIVLPSKLKFIDEGAFAKCTSLEYADLPDSVNTIGPNAFEGCTNLEWVYLPKQLMTIDSALFKGCRSLVYVVVSGNVTEIGAYAFDGCTTLTAIFYLGTEAQFDSITASSYGNDAIFKQIWYFYTMPTKDPKDVKTIAGKTVTFSTAASRSGCKFQWESLAPGSEEWKPCSSKSAKTATFSFTAKAKHDGYQYRCVITDEYDNHVPTYSATLTIVPAPKITKQPVNAEAKNGKSVSVSVEATGEGLTYTWYIAKKGSTKFSKSSITTNTYKTTMKSSVDGRKVYCVVTDKYGQTVKSNTVTLTLETTPLVITKQPESVTVKYGEKAKVTVAAEGDGLTYQWYYAKKGATKFSKASITKATYSAEMNTSRNGRQLYCVIKDKYGKSVKTDVVTINLEKTPLEIVTQPVSASAGYGKRATVTVVAQGDGLTYQWYYAKKGATKFSKASITKATYSAEMDTSRDGRQLYCVITDAYGNSVQTETVSISLERKELAIVTQPVSVSVKNGKTAKVTVKATGDGLTYQWYYAAKGSKKFSKASIKTATYSTTMNSSRNGRQLYCVITDAYGNSVKTNTVTIKKK